MVHEDRTTGIYVNLSCVGGLKMVHEDGTTRIKVIWYCVRVDEIGKGTCNI